MLAVGLRSIADATRRFLEVPGFAYYKSDWMDTGDDPALSPTVFLVEQFENSELVAHFHKQNQFQVFVEGTGKIGGHVIAPLTVHYAGAYTGYGPIIAGPEGLKYFTLRPIFEQGATRLKDAKGKMRKGPKRGAEFGPVAVPSIDDLVRASEVTHQELIPLADDGLGALLTRLPPNTEFEETDGGASQGRFLFLVQGNLIQSGRELGEWESLYLTTNEPFPMLVSGSAGAAILSLFVPPKHPRYLEPELGGSPPPKDVDVHG